MKNDDFRNLLFGHPMREKATSDIAANYRMFATSFAEYAGLDTSTILAVMSGAQGEVPDTWVRLARAWIKEAKLAKLLVQMQNILMKP